MNFALGRRGRVWHVVATPDADDAVPIARALLEEEDDFRVARTLDRPRRHDVPMVVVGRYKPCIAQAQADDAGRCHDPGRPPPRAGTHLHLVRPESRSSPPLVKDRHGGRLLLMQTVYAPAPLGLPPRKERVREAMAAPCLVSPTTHARCEPYVARPRPTPWRRIRVSDTRCGAVAAGRRVGDTRLR